MYVPSVLRYVFVMRFSFFVGGAPFLKIAGRNSIGFQNILAQRFRYHQLFFKGILNEVSTTKSASQRVKNIRMGVLHGIRP